ncbi:MAG: hypothetical protein HUJ91_01205, partial [Bacteroidales bacterium]|nr:hypothetical protein [Bacteroidales bacterium]
MKNISRALFVAALVLPTSNLQAQIDPTVEVSGVYRSNLTDVNKPHKSDNRVPESVQKFSVTSDYSIFERPYADLYEFTPYQIDSIGKTSRPKLPKFMLRGGTQYPISPELSIKSQLLSGPKWNLGVNGDFKSLFDNLDYKETSHSLGTSRVNTAFGANLKSSWRYGEIDVVADYRYDNYRDTYLDNYLNHGVKSFSIDFNAESAYPQDNSVYYNFDIKYETSSKALTGLEQLDTTYNNALFSIQGRLGSSFEKHRIYVDLIYKSAFMGKGDQQNSVGILEFTPIYEYAQDRFKIKAGARFGNKYIDKETANTVHPELDSKIELIRNGMWLRVMIGGGNDVNTVVDHIHSAPWICLGLKDGSYSVGNTIGSRNFESR